MSAKGNTKAEKAHHLFPLSLLGFMVNLWEERGCFFPILLSFLKIIIIWGSKSGCIGEKKKETPSLPQSSLPQVIGGGQRELQIKVD